jgi:Bax protein
VTFCHGRESNSEKYDYGAVFMQLMNQKNLTKWSVVGGMGIAVLIALGWVLSVDDQQIKPDTGNSSEVSAVNSTSQKTGSSPLTKANATLSGAPDFKLIPAGAERKKAFFDYFYPLVRKRNVELANTRQQILQMQKNKNNLSENDIAKLNQLAVQSKMASFSADSAKDWRTLLRRVDTVPPSLALAQAANESAWGTSRFALKGSNFFGQWCFKPGCGIVPASRAQNLKHEVAKFPSAEASVRSYIRNLNTNSSYANLRQIRENLRNQKKNITGHDLAPGLTKYSERGEEYISELRSMIKFNKLTQYDLAKSSN